MKLVSVEPGPFLVASFIFPPIIGLTARGGGSIAFTPEPAHIVSVSPQPTDPAARHIPDRTSGRWSGRSFPYPIPTEVQPTDV